MKPTFVTVITVGTVVTVVAVVAVMTVVTKQLCTPKNLTYLPTYVAVVTVLTVVTVVRVVTVVTVVTKKLFSPFFFPHQKKIYLKKTSQELRKAALRVGRLSRCQGVFTKRCH